MDTNKSINIGNKAGKVYLVGAGPGDPGLITVKGLECVRRADVIIYDRLIHPDILGQAHPQAELIYVGKDSSTHTVKQEEINLLLANKAKEGKTTVRLKGGDPFVFGRGGEEAEFLTREGLEVEIVPGVTSAVAVPAYAGIPVTHRGFCSSFGIITGHEDPQKPGSSIKWDKISTGLDTLVFLMGVTNLPTIVKELIKNGRAPSTPVAMIRWGTRSSQETLVGTLEDIVDKVKKTDFKPPAVTVVGEVVNLREKLRWFDSLPLFGKKILATRNRDQAGRLDMLLQQWGAKAVEFPAVKILPLTDFKEMDAQLNHARNYDWMLFTSHHGVQAVMDRLQQLKKDIRWLRGPKIGAIDPQTAEALHRLRLNVDFLTSKAGSEDIIQDFPENLRGKHILFFHADGFQEPLAGRLVQAGARVNCVRAYRTEVDSCETEQILNSLFNGRIDAVTFTSSNAVRNFVELVGKSGVASMPCGIAVACIGPVTAQTAAEHGLKPDILADQPTLESMVAAMVHYFLNLD